MRHALLLITDMFHFSWLIFQRDDIFTNKAKITFAYKKVTLFKMSVVCIHTAPVHRDVN
jgi:hypothetical protein